MNVFLSSTSSARKSMLVVMLYFTASKYVVILLTEPRLLLTALKVEIFPSFSRVQANLLAFELSVWITKWLWSNISSGDRNTFSSSWRARVPTQPRDSGFGCFVWVFYLYFWCFFKQWFHLVVAFTKTGCGNLCFITLQTCPTLYPDYSLLFVYAMWKNKV